MQYITYALIAALGGIVQTVSGFGSAVVIVLFLQKSFGMLVAPAIATTINLALTTSLSYKFRKSIEWDKIIIPAFIYTIVNNYVITLAKSANLSVLKKAFGIFLIVLAIYSLFFSKKMQIRASRKELAIFSIFSGITGGLFSVGGPLLALYYTAVSKSKESYIGNMQFLFMIICITSTITRVVTHIYTFDLLPVTLSGIAGVTLGKTAGIKIIEKLDKNILTKLIYAFVAISGILILV